MSVRMFLEVCVFEYQYVCRCVCEAVLGVQGIEGLNSHSLCSSWRNFSAGEAGNPP